MEPEAGVSYPVVLGPTILGKRQSEEYCSLRYDFLPASASKGGQGRLEIYSDSQVHLQLPSSTGSGPVQFSGRQELSKDGLDCVAIFDGTQFRLEVLQASVKGLRPLSVRKASAGRPSHAKGPHTVEAHPSHPASDSTATVTADDSSALSAGSPPVPAADSDHTGDGNDEAEDGLDDLEQALFEELNEDDGVKDAEQRAGQGTTANHPTSVHAAEARQQAAHQQQQQQAEQRHHSAAPTAHCQPAPAPPAAQAGVLAEAGGSADAKAGATAAQPQLPNLHSLSELDLEFFGDMVGSPNAAAESGEDEESSSEEESSGAEEEI